MSGTLKLSFGNGIDYDLGIINSFSERYTKSVMTTPIPTMSEDATYGIESGSGIVVSMEFSRVTPDNGIRSGSDPTKWTNGYWYTQVESIINRWQAKTNGCTITYTPGADNPYLPARVYNGYIKTMNRTYKPGDPTVIYTSVEFHVGTMVVNKGASAWPTKVDDFEISMSNGDQTQWFALMKGDVNCIESYTIEGGMEQPFESITMSIPKNRLSTVAPDLVNNIVAGGSKVILRAVGTSTMVVVKCKLSNKTYKVTAYCEAETIKGYTLKYDATFDPWYWIQHILTSGEYGMSFSTEIGEDNEPSFYYSLNPRETEYDDLTFRKGQNMWYILQVCALYLGCKIFFARGKAYCVDYRTDKVTKRNPGAVTNCKDIDLYTADEREPIYGRVTGQVTLGDEGADTIINSQSIQCTDPNGKATTYEYKALDQKVYRAGTELRIPELIQGGNFKQAEIVASNLVDYRLEPQQSVTFTLKEMENKGDALSWVPFFDPSTRVDSITSTADDFTVTNESTAPAGGRRMQKLLLSQYERNYPEGTSKYTFGVISNIDLAVSTSQILTNKKG